MRRIAAIFVVVSLAVTLEVAAPGDGPGSIGPTPAHGQTEPQPGTTATGTTSDSSAETTISPPTPPVCPSTTSRPFAPRSITIPGVTRRATVVAPPRRSGVPGTPSLSSAGKEQFAWDRAQRVLAGSRRGNLLLNAHVWPDGSAVGNRMLTRLQRGDRIVLHGTARTLCYRVTDRVQVSPRQGLRRYYNRLGRHQVAIVTCSGRRLASGYWTKRTIWYASPKP